MQKITKLASRLVLSAENIIRRQSSTISHPLSISQSHQTAIKRCIGQQFFSTNSKVMNDEVAEDDEHEFYEDKSPVSHKDTSHMITIDMSKHKLDEFGRAYGTGKRKTSIARVWLSEGSGCFTVNNKDVSEYFQPYQRNDVLKPFLTTMTSGMFDVDCTVKGGGISGQAGAVRLGISRALERYDPYYRLDLRPEGLLTRDSRRVERKKPGQKKARKQFQWVKR